MDYRRSWFTEVECILCDLELYKKYSVGSLKKGVHLRSLFKAASWIYECANSWNMLWKMTLFWWRMQLSAGFLYQSRPFCSRYPKLELEIMKHKINVSELTWTFMKSEIFKFFLSILGNSNSISNLSSVVAESWK